MDYTFSYDDKTIYKHCSSRNVNSIKNSIVFVLFKEYKIFGAISNDILIRAMGISMFWDTTLVLIKCTSEFVQHVYEYWKGFNMEIIDCSDINECKFHGDYIVTHTWPETLYSVSKLYGIQNLILIEEVTPLFDRFKKQHMKQSFKNRILTTKLMLNIITIKYRNYIKKAKKYVAISDEEADILVKRYSIHPDFISYDPIDTRFFKYKENKHRDSLLLFNDLQNSPKFAEIIEFCRNIGVTRVICLCGKTSYDFFTRGKN